uniref:Myb/SANT-like domain-containing protein n=1 Tax=Ananas comosus var. bracteatus TaxID=296719 RepID=A0A6V7NWC7_ANACO|nr:unnamed protein product [Ananas comosus var. bracteatus]
MDNAIPGCDVEGSSRRANQIRTRTANWTDHVDSILLSILMEEHALGNYVGGSFTRVAWVRIVQDFNSQTGQNLTKQHISNRLKVLKRLYMLYDKLANLSGWGWDTVNNIPTAGDATEWDAVIADKPFPAYNSIAFLCGSTVATGHYGMSSETMQPPTVVSSSSSSPGEAGTGGNETGGQCRSSRSPTPPLGQPAVGGYTSGSGHSSAGKRPRSPPPSAQTRKQCTFSVGRKKMSDLGAEALVEMVEIGKQRLEIAREMINIAKASQSTIPPIDVCMSRVYNLVGTTTIRAIAAGMSLRAESDRHLFMTLNDELALVWIDLQVGMHNLNHGPNFPGF